MRSSEIGPPTRPKGLAGGGGSERSAEGEKRGDERGDTRTFRPGCGRCERRGVGRGTWAAFQGTLSSLACASKRGTAPFDVSSLLSLSFSQSNRAADIESLERENDANIELLGERVGLLKNVTAGIRGEVQEHHALLDRMSMGMTGLQLGLGATVSKLQTVMRDPNRRPTFLAAIGLAFALFFLYLYLRA